MSRSSIQCGALHTVGPDAAQPADLTATIAMPRALLGEASAPVAIDRDPPPETDGQRLAEQAARKTRLLACVSHEARAPISHIIGYAEALSRRDAEIGEAERLECLNVIQSSARQLQRLIDDLVDASQIEAGHLPLVLGAVDVPTVAAQVAARARRAAPDRTIALAFPAAFPPAPGDAGRVEQVLEQLLGNALRHAPGAAITLGGRARRGAIEVWVRDTGPGFSPDQMAEPFAPRLGVQRGRGLGLGLSICQGIIDAHGGSIWLAPRRRGAAIHFRLPRRWQGRHAPEIDPYQTASAPSRQRGERL